MKWYAYPLSLTAWLLFGIFGFILIWNKVGETANPEWIYLLPAVAVSFVGISVLLTFLKLSWELEAFIQVACVLGPILWFMNEKEPYKPPVYVFLVEAGYTGEVTANFIHGKDAETRVRSTADTLFFRYDGFGKITLNEDFRMVKDAMQNRFYYRYPDGTQKKIDYFEKGKTLPSDTNLIIVVEDSLKSVKGKIEFVSWRVDHPNRFK